jgi:hypothetical protein
MFLRTAPVLLLGLAALTLPVQAQVEEYMLQPGSTVGPETRVKPKNCVTAADGAVTCDTELENSPGSTPAKPEFNPFRN